MFSKSGQVRALGGRVDSNRRTMNPKDVPEEGITFSDQTSFFKMCRNPPDTVIHLHRGESTTFLKGSNRGMILSPNWKMNRKASMLFI
jgi:hypothetical protein